MQQPLGTFACSAGPGRGFAHSQARGQDRPPSCPCLSPGPAPRPRSDFDPFSLRMELPGAVAALAQSAQANGGTAYVHCTGELAAAPATGPPRLGAHAGRGPP